jgi:hypothetical protein
MKSKKTPTTLLIIHSCPFDFDVRFGFSFLIFNSDSIEQKPSIEKPSVQFKARFKYEDVDVKDRVFAYEKLTTGFFEVDLTQR